MDFFLGCDVCKTKVDMALVNEAGTVLWEDKIPNNQLALTSFLLTVRGAYAGEQVTGIVEASGRYHYRY